MEKNYIKTVSIKDFKDSDLNIVDYADDDCVIINSLEGPNSPNEEIRLDCFLIIICAEGCIQVDINYKTYQLNAGDLMLALPNSIISHTMLSPGYKVKIAGFSTQFLQRVMKLEKDTWKTATYIRNNPVKVADDKMMRESRSNKLFILYRHLIMEKMNDEPHCYHKEVMQHLFSAIFCELMGRLDKEAGELTGPSSEETPSKGGGRQNDYILQKFMTMLPKDNGMHRSVSYYADALCYSPKHFSKVIKEACGVNPLKLINDQAIERIKYQLKRSEKSIKEIAEEFNFPNQSFFGKYVKSHLGMSPAEYRRSGKE